MPIIILPAKTIAYYSMLVDSYPAVNSRNQIRIAMPAEFLLQLRREFYPVFHRQPSGQLNVFGRKLCVFFQGFFGFIKQKSNSFLCNLELLCRLFEIFLFGHNLIS